MNISFGRQRSGSYRYLWNQKRYLWNCRTVTQVRLELSFDNTIYRHIDGEAMGSPLGPALDNIFVGYYEEKLFSEISKSAVYFRYVDNTFVIFQNEKESEEFLIRLNGLHSSL